MQPVKAFSWAWYWLFIRRNLCPAVGDVVDVLARLGIGRNAVVCGDCSRAGIVRGERHRQRIAVTRRICEHVRSEQLSGTIDGREGVERIDARRLRGLEH